MVLQIDYRSDGSVGQYKSDISLTDTASNDLVMQKQISVNNPLRYKVRSQSSLHVGTSSHGWASPISNNLAWIQSLRHGISAEFSVRTLSLIFRFFSGDLIPQSLNPLPGGEGGQVEGKVRAAAKRDTSTFVEANAYI